MSDEHITSGTTPQRSDTQRLLLIKEVNSAGAAAASTVAATPPVGNGTKAGNLWINSTNNYMWFWTGTAWQQILGEP